MTEKKYNIVQKFPNHEIFYLDSFAGKVLKYSKSEAEKILFLLNDQQDGVFEIKESKKL